MATAARRRLLAALVLLTARPIVRAQSPAAKVLWLNLKTAKALGLTLPPSLRVQAAQVIE